MATITHYSGLNNPKIAVPIVTALFGTLGLGTGLYAFLQPGAEPAKMFGITPPTDLTSNSEADARQRAYIQVHGIRNVANGIALIGLLAFWRLSSTCKINPTAANAVQKAIGILMAAGVTVGVSDGLILKKFAKVGGVGEVARSFADDNSNRHIGLSLPVLALAFGWWYL